MNGERILVLIIDRIGKTVALLKLHRMKTSLEKFRYMGMYLVTML